MTVVRFIHFLVHNTDTFDTTYIQLFGLREWLREFPAVIKDSWNIFKSE